MTDSGNSLPVVIVGGGIGGLAAALALSRKGIRSHVLEKSGSFGEIGAGIQLGPNVFRAFRELGIADAVSGKAVFVDSLKMMDSVTGEPIREVPLGAAFRERFGDPYAVIHRADLHRALLDACESAEGVELSTAREVEDFSEADDRITVSLQDGGHVTGAALIGADGLWSSIRRRLVDDGAPLVSGHIAYRAVLPIDRVPEELRWNSATLWAGPRNHLVHYPLRGGKQFNLVAVFHSNVYREGWDTAGDPDELMRRFEGVHHLPMSLLEQIEDWRMWVLCDREPVAEWSRGRATLLGDAAHPMLQYFAQGACMATEDAVCLAGRVAESGGDYTAAFAAYQKDRYLRCARVQLTARLLGDIYHAGGVARELRNLVFGGGPEDVGYEGFAWLYGGSLTDAA